MRLVISEGDRLLHDVIFSQNAARNSAGEFLLETQVMTHLGKHQAKFLGSGLESGPGRLKFLVIAVSWGFCVSLRSPESQKPGDRSAIAMAAKK